jgi:hypothetical protein
VEEPFKVVLLIVRGIFWEENINLTNFPANPLTEFVQPPKKIEINILPLLDLFRQNGK